MKRPLFLALLFVGIFIFSAGSAEGVLRGDTERLVQTERPLYRAGEVIIKRKGEAWFERVSVASGEDVTGALRRFRGRSDIEYAEPNYIARAFFTPNDPYYSYQWHLDNAVYGGIETEQAWDIARGNGVTIAVVDTGVAYENNGSFYKKAPDLVNTAFTAGFDFVNNDTHPNDDNGHGTHVTGTLAQSTDNNTGVAGVAFQASIMPVKVLDSRGSGTYADVADGIRWAADNGATVVNLSLGGPTPATYLESAIRYAYEKGVTIVAASGNDGAGVVSYPAAYDDYVIAVGATRFDEARAPYSNYGSALDIVAPGGDLSVDQNGDGYGDGVLQQTFNNRPYSFGYFFYQGTSMATPHIAGVAALVISSGIATTPDQVRLALQSTADDLGDSGRDDMFGWGIVNAGAALGYTTGPADNPPSVAITSPAANATVEGTINILAAATDDNGIDKVDFYADGAPIGADTAFPYEISWNSASVADGSHALKVVAVDTVGQTAEHLIYVIVDNINNPPVANAGPDQSLMDSNDDGVESVALNGSGSSDPDGGIAAYEWREGSNILGTSPIITPTFVVGIHVVTLTVVDDKGAAGSDDVTVEVLAYQNMLPVANAGSDKTVTDNDNNGSEPVTLDGSGSYDPDGSIVAFEWKEGPSVFGTSALIVKDFAVGIHTVTLTVTDDKGAASLDEVVVTVNPKPSGPTTMFFDDFEGGNPATHWTESGDGNWTIEQPAERNISGHASGNLVAHADQCSSAQGCVLTLKDAIDLSGYSSASLQFWRYVDRSLDNGEFLKVELYNGSSWDTVFYWTYRSGADDKWYYKTVDLSGYLVNTFKVRFTSKENSNGEDTEIDDVLIEALL
ncbi:MAG: hypothetical protein A3C80_00225 [Candidatus Ryanbacteria bacterium RIFCSPHIGHO2_02_FULL_45_43]|uniref:PKD/Chitinase domain-containing protein n=1 Tax=Candidatus Ryanbacteria bacterium RIFCSPHIGHO2_01_45_13 TaxID=1802112 RepID=A0A1G2G098_9BACT|nr:MAG: hypothetical protein A2718_01610 [Candidatus Ryanbacteria bacterium RIFCSPHIGHO2_01_FULL_44_130]OGZ43765.1 MAG: hypothetical protein A2W41_04730 [Candidatus Ryanbacteria bacterium RIFCSPHIGHO2_01_45_13]OGZ47707.1 MAG: hypothetical protein A3C80_00225 [Candidatus Ryanbacteria bacterium RIFCSPHIGHO2_02_FULL_45_43]OGZ49603.1 MAG: hypothetical protein A3E55_04225 [Candidatus Ryanbacteria bacterium RIFCSPHIGHO2_12_FULL_44_20]OGZ51285.1 MAG: hypothetical protein A3A17_04550 [Candidatus Ryanba